MPNGKERPGLFGKLGFVDQILIAANLVPDRIKDPMLDASMKIAKGLVAVDGSQINTDGLSDADSAAYEKSMTKIATRIFYAGSATNDVQTQRLIDDHNRLVERIRIKQEAGVEDKLTGVERSTVPPANMLSRLHKKTKQQKELDESNEAKRNARLPWYQRKY